MSISKAEINEKIEEGWIRCLVTFEIVGKPKEHVEQTIELYIQKILEDKAIHVIDTHKEEATELEDENEGFFSAFCEIEMLLKNVESIMHLSINLMPASIEILEPSEFSFSGLDLQNWSNDLLSRLHEIAQQVRNEKQKSTYVQKTLFSLIENFVVVLLGTGPKKAIELSKLTGIEEKKVEEILSDMKEKGHVLKEGENWILQRKEK